MDDISSEVWVSNNDFLENYDELKKTNVTHRKLTLYERTSILGVRATQLSLGAEPLVNIPEYVDDVVEIAEMELEQKKIPFIIKRKMDTRVDYWKMEDIII